MSTPIKPFENQQQDFQHISLDSLIQVSNVLLQI